MKHKDKIKMARKMMSNKEKAKGMSVFDSQAWDERKTAKADKVYESRIKKTKLQSK